MNLENKWGFRKVWTPLLFLIAKTIMCKNLNIYIHYVGHRVPGENKRSTWDLRGGRWSWTLNFAQKRSWVGRWSWAEQVGRLLLRVVQVVHQQRCNRHCLSDSVQHSSWNQLRSAQVAGQWQGDTALTLPLFWWRSTVSLVFFGRFPQSSLSLSPVSPYHSAPVPNRPSRLHGR